VTEYDYSVGPDTVPVKELYLFYGIVILGLLSSDIPALF